MMNLNNWWNIARQWFTAEIFVNNTLDKDISYNKKAYQIYPPENKRFQPEYLQYEKYFDLQKVEHLLTVKEKQFPDKPWTILTTGGSFNPLHIMHVKILEIATEILSRKMNILLCVLVPSSDSHVSRKLEEEALSLEHRERICQQISDKFDWLTTFRLGHPLVTRSMDILDSICSHRFPNENFFFMEVCGGDHCEVHKLWRYPLVCVSRPSYDKLIVEALKSKEDDPEFIFIEDKRISALSSTLVRNFIQDRSDAIYDLLFPETIEYLKQIKYLQ